jgi:hypothetical protein
VTKPLGGLMATGHPCLQDTPESERRFESSLPYSSTPGVSMSKLYVIVQEDLSPGMKIAQGGHALCSFSSDHAEVYRDWYTTSNNLVVLQAPDLQVLADSLSEKGFRSSCFHEPDLNDQLTALAVEPAAQRWLSNLRLAGWTEKTRVVERRVEVPRPSLWRQVVSLFS